MQTGIDVVTGAFSYTGQYITRTLLASGRSVRTLTGHPDSEHPLARRVEAHPYHFGCPDRLVDSLRGADTLYNTYWVRFPHSGQDYDSAVRNLRILIGSAVKAGVRKIVHTSIINPSETSPYAYFRGKASVESALVESGLAYSILRPTVIFGPEDILINNVGWMVRKFPVFLLPGNGDYKIQPIYVQDFAELAVRVGTTEKSEVINATGPETFTYRELVARVCTALNRRVILLPAPVSIFYGFAAAMGLLLGDVVLTYEEILALKEGILYSTRPAAGTTRLSEWLEANASTIGLEYRSEVARHFSSKGVRRHAGQIERGKAPVHSVLG